MLNDNIIREHVSIFCRASEFSAPCQHPRAQIRFLDIRIIGSLSARLSAGGFLIKFSPHNPCGGFFSATAIDEKPAG
jgi:hypothetical protein